MAKRKRNKGPRRSHLKRWSASMINGGQRIDSDTHFVLNRGHIESMGVPNTGRNWDIKSWRARLKRNYIEDGEDIRGNTDLEPVVRGRPQEFQPIPQTVTTLNDMIARGLDYKTHPLMEKREAKDRIVNGKDPWNEIVIKNTDDYKLAVCFQGDKAIFVEVYKSIKTVATTPPYPNVKKALATYEIVGARKLNWGMHKPYQHECKEHSQVGT